MPDSSPLLELIARRRAVYTPAFSPEPIPEEMIHTLLEAANWAPSHRRTEPWRFQVFRAGAREKLANWLEMAAAMQAAPAPLNETTREKLRQNIFRSDTILAIVMQRDPRESVPEWEEIAALGAAVQNLWLAATDAGLGGYWSTPGLISHLASVMGLPDGQRCMGLFYLGFPGQTPPPGQRNPVGEKVVWHNQ